MSWSLAALIEATPWLVNVTVTVCCSPFRLSASERAGSPPPADVHAPRPGSSAGPSAGVVP